MAGWYCKLADQLEGVANATRRAEIEASQCMTCADIMRDKVVIGGPETVAARLLELQDLLGIDGILAELNFGGLLPPDRMMRSLQLLCEDVRPRIRPRA